MGGRGVLCMWMSSGGSSSACRALCVVRDPALRRTLRRSLLASGSEVEFRDSVSEHDVRPGTILFIDRASREDAGMPALLQILGDEGRVVILGDSLADTGLVELLRERPLDHLISEGTPDELELVVTSFKLLSGDIFGLEKYLSWGAAVSESEVCSYQDKRTAIEGVARAAEAVGARRQLVSKIERAADELLMNALYDAPAAVGQGQPDLQQVIRDATVPLDRTGASALLRHASDGRYFAVSVLDRHGALDKRAIVDSVLRARAERGEPRQQGGAGLGLYFVLTSVTRFIVNLEPGHRTEVVCLFDLRERGRDSEAWARSLHIFTSDR